MKTFPDTPTRCYETDKGTLEAYWWQGRNVYYLNGIKLQDSTARALLGILGLSHNESMSKYKYDLAYEVEYIKRMRQQS